MEPSALTFKKKKSLATDRQMREFQSNFLIASKENFLLSQNLIWYLTSFKNVNRYGAADV